MPTMILDLQFTCDDCGRSTGNAFRTEDGRPVCPGCAEQYEHCDRCDAYAEDTVWTDDDQEVCGSCATRHYTGCDRCDKVSDRLTRTADSSHVCRRCAEFAYRECEGCDELISVGNYYCESCQPDDECTCWDCTNEYDDYSDLINDYSYKPNPVFHGEGPLFLGAEIEINVPHGDLEDCAEIATSHLGGLGYLKEDSSIGHGFEIVTHPMSYDWAMEYFPWEMLANLVDNGCDATGNGLHVHVSRAAFASPSHVYRWMKFFYRNVQQVITVARRESHDWACFDSYGRRNVKDYAKGAKGARYQAINTQNDDTFELRVFASSLDPREVKAALGLAAASVEYTRDLRVPDIARRRGWEWTSFVAWLLDRLEYAPLAAELEALACVS